jgi:hypothetical protein
MSVPCQLVIPLVKDAFEMYGIGFPKATTQAGTIGCLIITINDTSIGNLPLIITISDTCKNQPKRLDSDNTINLSRLISEP